MKEKIKRLFRNHKINYILVGILGVIIGGGIFGTLGIVATTNRLEAKYVMYTKDGETMTVQDAIKDLYVLAKNNGGGNNQTIAVGTSNAEGYKITVPYTGNYATISCVYGTDETYGSKGTINGNTCTFTGTSSNQTLYYKIMASNDDGKMYEYSGSAVTGASGVTIVKTDLPTGVKAIVYLDPTNLGTNCTASNSTTGNGTSGCMKWYAFKEDTNSYTMILDHNTTARVAWNSSGKSTDGMKEVQTELNNLVNVTKWKVTPRLIKAQEVANITGNASWTTNSTEDEYFYLDSNTRTQTATSQNASKYYWLFDYTKNCTSYGCKVADSSTLGYWTDTPLYNNAYNRVWDVSYEGMVGWSGMVNTDYGVRPVITVQKSNF